MLQVYDVITSGSDGTSGRHRAKDTDRLRKYSAYGADQPYIGAHLQLRPPQPPQQVADDVGVCSLLGRVGRISRQRQQLSERLKSLQKNGARLL